MTSKPKSFFKIASEIHRHVSYRYKLAMILTGSKARLEPPAPDTIMPGKHLLAGSEKEIPRPCPRMTMLAGLSARNR